MIRVHFREVEQDCRVKTKYHIVRNFQEKHCDEAQDYPEPLVDAQILRSKSNQRPKSPDLKTLTRHIVPKRAVRSCSRRETGQEFPRCKWSTRTQYFNHITCWQSRLCEYMEVGWQQCNADIFQQQLEGDVAM